MQYGKVNVGCNLTMCTYIYTYIQVGTDNKQNDFYLQIHLWVIYTRTVE